MLHSQIVRQPGSSGELHACVHACTALRIVVAAVALVAPKRRAAPSASKRARKVREEPEIKQDSQAELRRFFIPSNSAGGIVGTSTGAMVPPDAVPVAVVEGPGVFRVPAVPQRKRAQKRQHESEIDSSMDASSLPADEFEAFFH